jgi:fucose permease
MSFKHKAVAGEALALAIGKGFAITVTAGLVAEQVPILTFTVQLPAVAFAKVLLALGTPWLRPALNHS